MNKIYLLITVVLLCLSSVSWAGGYSMMQDMPEQNVIMIPQENPRHWYFEMAIGGGTLLLGAAGLWLRYKRK
jgi:hypothetical protein